MNMDIGLMQLIVSMVSLVFTAGFFLYFIKQQNKLLRSFTPIIRNVMSNLGKASAEQREVKQVEREIIDDIKQNIPNMFPELEVLGSMGLISEETLEKIQNNPQVIPILVQRYAPLIKMFIGAIKQKQGQGQQARFDF